MMRSMLLAFTMLAAGTAASAQTGQASTLALAGPLGDHAVIQRGAPIILSGTAAAGATVTATLGDAQARARADRTGAWTLTLPARAAAEGLTLAISDSAGGRIALGNIAVGDVYLCSGQSNMELPVERALNADGEIMTSDDPGLRLLQVPHAHAVRPAAALPAGTRWAAATPASVRSFSAACYYMGQALRSGRTVPIGLIHASWGGTQLRTWLSPEGIRRIGAEDELAIAVQHGDDPLRAIQRFAPVWEGWWRQTTGDQPGTEPWRQPDRLNWLPMPSMIGWNSWPGRELANFSGVVWARRTLRLTGAQARAGGTLELGVIDEMDHVWINGMPVGSDFSWSESRRYRVPAEALRDGDNEVVVAIGNGWGNGGFNGPASVFRFVPQAGDPIALGDGWRYAIGLRGQTPPHPPWDAIAGPGLAHNAMVAPLGTLRLAGIAWYQGESDVGIPGYRERQAALFAGWRAQFGAQTPIAIVQLAAFGGPQIAADAVGWGRLRDDQRLAAVDNARVALVSAIDLGDRTDIHPANKNEVGRRLARAFRGEALPMPQVVRRAGDRLIVDIAGVDGSLVTWSGNRVLGVALCGGTAASCRWADARADGSTIVITPDGQPVTTIRYGWGDTPVINLYDARHIPVPAFELAVPAG